MARNYKGIGKGRYKTTRGVRKGKVFKFGKAGSHVYAGKDGTKVKIHKGGRREVIRPKKVDPYKSQVDAAVDLEFGDTDLELAKQRRVSGQASLNVGDWWSGYQRDVEAARRRGQAGSQQAQQQVYGQANTARAQDQSQSAKMDEEAQKQAALRGTTAGPNVAAQAQASRTALSSSFGGLVGAQGAAQNAYMADKYRIGGGIRASELQKEQGRGRQIDEEARKVASKKGAYRTSARASLVDAERKAQLEAAAFGLDVSKATDTAADRAADNRRQARADRQAAKDRAAGRRVQRRGQDVTIRGQDLTDRRAREKGGPNAKGKFTPTALRGNKTKLRSAIQLAKDTGDAKPGRGKTLRQFLASEGYKDPVLGKVATEYAIYGGVVSKGLRAKFKKAYGFNPKLAKRGKPIPKKKGSGQRGTGRPS